MTCAACGAENREGARFCVKCGATLALACPSCGAPYEHGDVFCASCGNRLEATDPPSTDVADAPVTERRLVSVLFADLVGFTARSEDQDPEEVRELLSRYFDSARRVIERYGGTVEKFIGDAVMAIWGSPIAQEDDAERAVRAALDLVAAVPELDERLRARAGVLTGEAAVTIGAEREGLIAGDLVNTASRVQAAASPGTVLVGDATRRATTAAIAYDEAGVHELRGKAEPIPLWRALRVIAARRGEGRAEGLEAPFVGRSAELRLVRDLFHATAEERRGRLVSVVGVAGIGKSRLAWEFEKYIDGLVDTVRWHRGRCLAYGDGVAFWALAEMVRMRALIMEEESPEEALAKLRDTLAEHVPDVDERSWLEPRLAHLLGLAERSGAEREELFSAWRLFFERLADEYPTVLVFEDLQWADAALLDFIQYLLEWSRSYPLFVLTLARPELAERHPDWTVGKRDLTLLSLEPLPAEAMDELLRGLVPGLPDELRNRIRDRAEGVPLYAVETVRMLLDRGLLERAGDEYRPVGAVESLEVPETLHALIAARLDGLPPDERGLLHDASVLGKTFTKQALAALTGADEQALDPLLTSLVRKDVLAFQSDPRSPERGQFGFLQALVQKVAHDTLSRHERKARHLAAAEYFETSWGSETDEIVEMIAAHYFAAYRADPSAEDAERIRKKAGNGLARGGERAASLGAHAEAKRYFVQAAELADEPVEEASLLERAGDSARAASPTGAIAHYERSIQLFEAEGRTHAAARVSARLGLALWLVGRGDEALARMEESFAVLEADEPDEDFAAFAAELARLYFFDGDLGRATARVELALQIAEALWLPAVLADALNTKHLILEVMGRREEAIGLIRHSLALALENDALLGVLRAYLNLSHTLAVGGSSREALAADREGLALARRLGDRSWEISFLQHVASHQFFLGDWDESIATCELAGTDDRWALAANTLWPRPFVEVNRGNVKPAAARLDAWQVASDVQERSTYNLARAIVLFAGGEATEALDAAEAAFNSREVQGMHVFVQLGFVTAGEAALALGDTERVESLLAVVRALRPGETPRLLRAQSARFEARLAELRGEHDRVEPSFAAAIASFADLELPFWRAVTQLEYAEWLGERTRDDEADPLLEEAHKTFEALGARPWLARLETNRRPRPLEEVAG